MNSTAALLATVVLGSASGLHAADAGAAAAESATLAGETGLTLSLQEGVRQEAAGQATTIPTPAKRFGDRGSWWISLGGGYANDFGDMSDFNAYGAVSNFLADGLEFGVELGGWYFLQDGDDAGGINGSMVVRYHFWRSEDRDWTVYADVGIGLIATSDDVPPGGTSFNFTPRAGVGFTRALTEDLRLQVGLRWHHMSNARIDGDDSNPGHDALMIYAGVVIPW